MKYFIPKSYQLAEKGEWIPSADIFEFGQNEGKITEEYSLEDQICNTKELANELITNHCKKLGWRLSMTQSM